MTITYKQFTVNQLERDLKDIEKELSFSLSYKNNKRTSNLTATKSNFFNVFHSNIWKKILMKHKIIALYWLELELQKHQGRKLGCMLNIDPDFVKPVHVSYDKSINKFKLTVNPSKLFNNDLNPNNVPFNYAVKLYELGLDSKRQWLQNKVNNKGLQSLTEEQAKFLDFNNIVPRSYASYKLYHYKLPILLTKKEKKDIALYENQYDRVKIKNATLYFRDKMNNAEKDLRMLDYVWRNKYQAIYNNIKRIDEWYYKYVTEKDKAIYSTGILENYSKLKFSEKDKEI